MTHDIYVDILPYRASKGKALSYRAGKWQIDKNRILTAGNSGNDKDMLTCRVKGVVVSNYSEEIDPLSMNRSINFADSPHAAGVLEGEIYWRKNIDRVIK